MLSVAELEGAVSVCVTLAITPPTATTSRDLTLNLTTSDGTGKSLYQLTFKLCVFLMSASAGVDYTTVSMNVVFSHGSTNGTMQCVCVSIIDDGDPLEGNETFTVTLTTASFVILTQSTTDITIIESNGMDCRKWWISILLPMGHAHLV